jgi:hypothetical protein
MGWIEFKALPGVISGASYFVVAFSVESILKFLHDFDCTDLAKFREKLTHFPDLAPTLIIRVMKMYWLSRSNSRANSGLQVGKRLRRRSLVLSWTRFVSGRHHWVSIFGIS